MEERNKSRNTSFSLLARETCKEKIPFTLLYFSFVILSVSFISLLPPQALAFHL